MSSLVEIQMSLGYAENLAQIFNAIKLYIATRDYRMHDEKEL
jgi:hypothetical protein